MISRRALLRRAILGAGASVVASPLRSQQDSPPAIADTSNLFAGMDPTAFRAVRLAPKPGAGPSMSPEQRDALEHRIKCQCGCTLDVYTCRTTDFSCQVSPAMHRDVMALVAGGYDAREILDAMVNAYGERVLMAPPKQGFNVLGYIVPSIAVAIAAVVIAVVLRRWHSASPVVAAPRVAAIDATPDELAQIDAAIRNDA